MSLYNNRYGSPRSFSSRSHGSLSGRPSVYRISTGFQPVMQRSSSGLNLSRITPSSSTFLLSSLPNMEVDPQMQQLRNQEKEQIKGLNNQFVNFIDKVQDLEKQNKILETQLALLKEKDAYKSNIDQITQVSANRLKQQIDGLLHEKEKLQLELHNMQGLVEELKNRYEDDINRRNQIENDFVLTKKDLDDAYLHRVDNESKLETLTDEIQYLKQLYNEELKELEHQVNNAKVTVSMDNSRDFEMKQIMDEVKAQYQAMTQKSQQEAEYWYNCKRANLESAISMAEEHGEDAVRNAKSHIQDLEVALKREKQDMALKVRECQELMNIKLALDIEIATYRKLLEGEETRMQDQKPNLQANAIDKLASTLNFEVKSTPPVQAAPNPKKVVLVKTIETADGKQVTEGSKYSAQ
ncbi:keratin, type II cytoskeletal 8 isoform X3 [Xenopus laevis]|uniref:Keratin, type II cytoskeletal 8 isoform X3 n=1 Tax=Xenopus laevis TaxID=8355 RepID=A0A8J0U0A1_XENLA|nr:keratin, type II cytoskeletal 8 isoform X3 [Xenopus laevis]